MGKGRDPLAGPLPQHLKEAESPFQLHEKEKSSGCLLVDNRREKSSLSPPVLPQEIEERSLSKKSPVLHSASKPEMSSPLARRLEQEQCPLQVTFGKGRFSGRDSFTSWAVFICRGMKGSRKQVLTVSFTLSIDGRELALQKRGWSSPQPSKKEIWPLNLKKNERTPPPHALNLPPFYSW